VTRAQQSLRHAPPMSARRRPWCRAGAPPHAKPARPSARGGAGGAAASSGALLTPCICRAPKAAGAVAKPGLAALRAVCDEETAGKRKAPAANPFVRKPKAPKA